MMWWIAIISLIIVAWLVDYGRPVFTRRQSSLSRVEAQDAEALAIKNMVRSYGVMSAPVTLQQRTSEISIQIRNIEQRIGRLEVELERLKEPQGDVAIIPFPMDRPSAASL